MWKVFHPFINRIKGMHQSTINGKRVSIFLGRDYHFQDDMLGHGGSSSSYPSSLDLVELKHLQNHGGVPHTPDNCKTALRDIKHYNGMFIENTCDDRNNNNNRKNAKFHCSVIQKMLFPVADLTYVVPPGLHITLGITLKLFNLVNKECRDLDEETAQSNEDEVRHRNELNSNWQ